MPEEPRDVAPVPGCHGCVSPPEAGLVPRSTAPLCRASPGPRRPHCSLQRAILFFFFHGRAMSQPQHRPPALGACNPHANPDPELASWVPSCFLLQRKKEKKPNTQTQPFHAPWHLGAALGHAAAGRRCEPSPGWLVPKCSIPGTGWLDRSGWLSSARFTQTRCVHPYLCFFSSSLPLLPHVSSPAGAY